MAVLLVRHAAAGDRDKWQGDDSVRPLTEKGRAQADALVRTLDEHRVDEIRSSPARRCMETVEPLAAARGVSVEPDHRLFEGDSRGAIELVRELLGAGANVALCSHGDVVPDVVEALGFDCNRCAKGSTWVLDGETAVYLPPPA